MTHTFHHAITAKSFRKKIKLTSRQKRTTSPRGSVQYSPSTDPKRDSTFLY